MLTCRFCQRCLEAFREFSDAWDRAHSNEHELWSQESGHNRELIRQAYAIAKTDSPAGFRLYLEAADDGSAWSMQMAGLAYWTGRGVATDLGRAQDYFRRAIHAGSWMATIYYARFLAEQRHYDGCESLLEDGVAAEFVPAYYWLARFRYEHCRTPEVCREVRPMLEYAATKGHPAAKRLLAQWMLFGRCGRREIVGGLILAVRSAVQWAREMPKYARS